MPSNESEETSKSRPPRDRTESNPTTSLNGLKALMNGREGRPPAFWTLQRIAKAGGHLAVLNNLLRYSSLLVNVTDRSLIMDYLSDYKAAFKSFEEFGSVEPSDLPPFVHLCTQRKRPNLACRSVRE